MIECKVVVKVRSSNNMVRTFYKFVHLPIVPRIGDTISFSMDGETVADSIVACVLLRVGIASPIVYMNDECPDDNELDFEIEFWSGSRGFTEVVPHGKKKANKATPEL